MTYGDCFLIICVRNYLKRECAHSDEIINDLDFWKSVFSLLHPLPVYIFAVVVLVLCFISFFLTFHLLFLFLFSSSYYLLLRLIIFKQVTICSKSHIQSWWLKVSVWLRPEFVPKANNYRPVRLLNLYSFSAEMFTRGLLSNIRSIKLLNHRTEDLCAHMCICVCVCVCVCVHVLSRTSWQWWDCNHWLPGRFPSKPQLTGPFMFLFFVQGLDRAITSIVKQITAIVLSWGSGKNMP